MKYIDSPHEVHIHVRRLVVDRASLRDDAGSGGLRESLSARIADRVGSFGVRQENRAPDRFDLTDAIADAIATRVSMHLADATRRAAD